MEAAQQMQDCQQTCSVTPKGTLQSLIRKLNKQEGNFGEKRKHEKDEKDDITKVKTLKK